jgi:hypothetical protein
MFFFGRNRFDDPSAEFWKWWPGARDRIARSIVTGTYDNRLIGEITKHVRRVHREMAWELQPGTAAAHAFCLSPEGDPERRQVALRWLESAPKADTTWEYHASKPPAASLMSLQVGGSQFDLQAMRASASWDPTRRLVDVRLWHPGFERVGDEVRMQVGFLFLDHLLGEDGVERWIGRIDLLGEPPDGLSPAELKGLVERHAAEPPTGDSWQVGEVRRPDGSPAIVAVDAALKRIDHPFHDLHVWVRMLWGAERHPTDTESAQLEAEEDEFLRRMGDAAILAARVTVPGMRIWHFVTRDFDTMKPAIDGWAAWLPDALSPGLPQRRLQIDGGGDMTWAFRHDLGTAGFGPLTP